MHGEQLGYKSIPSWGLLRNTYASEELETEWQANWDEYASDNNRSINDSSPYSEASSIDDKMATFISFYRNSIREGHDPTGFLVGLEHDDEDVRIITTFALDDVWQFDKELALAGFVKATHDSSPRVRMFAIEALLIALYGAGIESNGAPIEDITDKEKETLQGVLAGSIRDINDAAGFIPQTG